MTPQPQRIEHALAYHRGRVTQLVHEASPWASPVAGPIRCDREAEMVADIMARLLRRASMIVASAEFAKERAPADGLADAQAAYQGLFDRLQTVLNRLVDAKKKWEARKQ